MKKTFSYINNNWYKILVCFLLGIQAVVFLTFRENSYIQIHDNLDLFMAHYQMIKNEGAFFSQNVDMPMLHGIDRDLLGSEFLLYNFLYVILPGFAAYMTGYALKILIGIISFVLLAKDIYKERYDKYKPLIIVVATAFGLIPVFPAYGIAFTSVPLIILLLRKLYYAEELKKRILLYLAVFAYPILSYFSYHGFFILCYMVCAVIILWIKNKKLPKSMLVSLVVLSLGYMTWEYRLFRAMLFNDTVTIRTTMNHGNLTFAQALKTAFDEFIRASFHSQDSHTYIVLGVSIIGLIMINISYIKRQQTKKIWTEPANLIMGWIIFNVLIFGFYQYEPFRHLIEMIVPKLTGFEFARTAYFNTFLWYALLLVILTRLYDMGKSGGIKVANAIAVIAALVVMFVPAMYNDFYYTCYNQAYRIIKHKDTSTLNYREFYSEPLFTALKNTINYDGEWCCAYGFHPAVLNYNGIATLDGYLGMYPQEYKDRWQRVIEPALENSPSLRSYYEGWGARVSLYSGNDENTYAPLRVMEPEDTRLLVDIDELKALDCRYILSRVEFSNAEELGIHLIGTVSGGNSPYHIIIYSVD